MTSVPDDHVVLNRDFLEERLKDEMQEVVLTQRRRCAKNSQSGSTLKLLTHPYGNSRNRDMAGTYEMFTIPLC